MQLGRLKEWREAAGYTQRELAARADTGQKTVARAELGYSVTPRTARRIAEALGRDVADLLEHPPAPADISAPKAKASPSSAPDKASEERRTPPESQRVTSEARLEKQPVLSDEERRAELLKKQQVFVRAHDLLKELAAKYKDEGDEERFLKLACVTGLANCGAAMDLKEDKVASNEVPEAIGARYLIDALYDRLIAEMQEMRIKGKESEGLDEFTQRFREREKRQRRSEEEQRAQIV